MDADRIAAQLVGGDGARPSSDCEAFVMAWEKCFLVPYRDLGGRWTVGYGHLLGVDEPREPITQEEAADLFYLDLQITAQGVARLIYLPLEQRQFDALCAFAFNVGLGNLAVSTLRKRVNGGYMDEAADQFLVWNKYKDSSGAYIESRGLRRRREAERALFANGDYSGRP